MAVKFFISVAALAAVTGLDASVASAFITVVPFAPSAFNMNEAVMDASLGITGYSIERFDSTLLLPGLFYELGAPSPLGPTNVLPALITTAVDPGAANNYWDDTYLLINNNTNAYPDSGVRTLSTTFYPPAGTTSFGVGISNAQSASLPNQFPIADHELFIIGVSFGLLESLPGWVTGRVRNIYLRIDASGPDVITSVRVHTLNNRTEEVMAFDHIAIIPSPGSAALLSLIGLLAGRRRR